MRTFFILFVFLIIFLLPFAASASVLDIQEVKSESGMTAWLVEDHSVPVIALTFAFKEAGAKNDPEEKQGLARLASNTMDEGAGNLDSQAFQKELQDLSISLSFGTDRDHFSGSVKTLTRNKARAFELLKLALTQPRFDEEPLQRMIAANQARIKSSLSDPEWMAARLQNDRVFEGHPYALNSGGTLSSLEKITAEDLRAFHKTLGKNALVVSASGDITGPELKTLLDDVFSGLPDVSSSESSDMALQNAGKIFLYEQDIPQTIIEITQGGIDRNDPDYQSAQVMNFVLGSSGFGSRLTEEIREKRGLTYGIYTYFQNYDAVDTMNITTSTANENTSEMLALIRAEWDKMKNTVITEKELADAKSYLIGSLPLSLTSTDRIAGLLLSLQIDGLPLDYLDRREEEIRQTTAQDVQKIAQRLLRPENFTTVLVGQPQGIKDAHTVESLPNVE